MADINVGSAVGYLDLDIEGFLRKLKTAQDEADRSSNLMQTSMSKLSDGLETIGSKISSAGSTLTKAVTLPFAGLATAGAKTAIDFESEMSKVKAITQASGDEFSALRDKAIELGADTKFSSQEVAQAMVEMAKAGWDTQKILDGMSGVLSATAASGEGLASVSTIVADAITGFQMEAGDATRVADLLTQAANSGTINISDLGETFKYVAPVAASMGISIEEITTAVSAMSMAGIKGSQAGTSLRTTLINLSKPTEQTASAMDQIGLEIADSEGNFYSLSEIIERMREGMSGLTQEQQFNIAATLAGKEGASGLLAILNLTPEAYNAIAESMNTCSGVAEETATVMQDNTASAFEQFGGALESLAIKFMDNVLPHLRDFVVKLTEMVDRFSELDPEMQENILKWGLIAAAIGPALQAIGGATSGLGSIIKTAQQVPDALNNISTGFMGVLKAVNGVPAAANASMSSLLAPIAAVTAAVAALVAIFVTLWNNNEEFKDKMIGIWEEIKEKLTGFFQGITDRINDLGFDFENFTEVVSALWNEFCNLFAPTFEFAFQTVSNHLEFALNTITSVLDIFIGLFTGDWERLWEGVKGIFEGIVDFIANHFEAWGDAFIGIADTILGWFGTSWEEAWESIKKFFVDLWDGIKKFFEDTWNGLTNFFEDCWNGIIDFFTKSIPEFIDNAVKAGKGFFENLVKFFKELPYKIGFFLGETLAKIATWVVNITRKAIEAGKDFIESVIKFFSELPGKVWNWLRNTYDKIVTWASDSIAKAYDTGKEFLETVIEFISQLPGKIWEWLTKTIERIGTWVGNMGRKGAEAISSLIENIIEGAKQLPDKMLEIGSNIVNGIWDGIVAAKDNFVNSVTGFFTGIIDGIKSGLGIASPSKVFANEIGRWLPPGIAEGFKKALPASIREMQSQLNKSATSFADEFDITPVITTGILGDLIDMSGNYSSVGLRRNIASSNNDIKVEVVVNANVANDYDAKRLGEQIGISIEHKLRSKGVAVI